MPLALFGAGAVAKSFLSRVPWLPARLGPVGAPSFRLASRIVNSMRAGHAVTELAEAPVRWTGKSVLLCDSGEDSHALEPIRRHGAAVASLNPLEGLRSQFIVEGDRTAVREAKHLVRDLSGQAIELSSDKMALYLAGHSFGSELFIPLVAACVDSIAAACGSTPRAVRIAEGLYQRWLRAYLHAGRKSWTGPLAWGDEDSVLREVEALRKADPERERLYRELAVFALSWSGRHPELLRKLLGDGSRPTGDGK